MASDTPRGGRYARVRYRRDDGDGPRTRTVTLGSVTEEHDALGEFTGGVEVDSEGEVIWRDGGTTCTRHLIHEDAIVSKTPMRMDLDLGILVNEKEA